MKLASACHDFLTYCRLERQLSQHTLAAYRQDLDEFCRLVTADTIAQVTGEALVTYARTLATWRNLAPATIRRRIACARAMFAWLRRQRVIPENPFGTVELRVRVPNCLPKYLTIREVKALLGEAGKLCPTTHLAVRLLFTTGIRISELAAIRLSAVDLEQGTIRIFGKGSRERQVFVPDERTVSALKNYIADHHQVTDQSRRLLVNSRGRPATAACLRARITAAARNAGLRRRMTPHSLRHTAATTLLEAGVDIRFVQRLLGHQSIATTQIYTHVSDRALKAAIVAAHGRGVTRMLEE